MSNQTIIEALQNSLMAAARFNRSDMVAPVQDVGDVHQQVNNFSIRQELQAKTERFRKGVKIFYRSKSNAATGC